VEPAGAGAGAVGVTPFAELGFPLSGHATPKRRFAVNSKIRRPGFPLLVPAGEETAASVLVANQVMLPRRRRSS